MNRVVVGILLLCCNVIHGGPQELLKKEEKLVYARYKDQIERGEAPVDYVIKAIKEHKNHVLRKLLREYSHLIQFNAQVDGEGLIYTATTAKNLYAVELLIFYKSNPDIAGPNEMAPIILSISNEDNEITDALLAAGVKTNVIFDELTPLGLAAAQGKIVLVLKLLDHGANQHFPSEHYYQAVLAKLLMDNYGTEDGEKLAESLASTMDNFVQD